MKINELFKKTLTAVGALKVLTFVLMATMLISCSDDESVQQPTIETEDFEVVTNDTPKLFTTLPTYVFDDKYPKSAEALIRRIKSRSAVLDDATVTVVFTDSRARRLDDADMRNIVNLYLRGGNIVYVEPTNEGITAWMKQIKEVYKEMAAEGSLAMIYPPFAASFCSRFMNAKNDTNGSPLPPFADKADSDGIICDAIALRGSDLYVVSDLDDNSARKIVSEEIDEETGEVLSTNVKENTAPETITDYMYGQHAETLVEWLNKQPDYMDDKEKQMAMGRQMMAQSNDLEKSNLDDIIDAQKYTITEPVYDIHGVGSEPVTRNYYIWSVYDPKEKADYYLIKETVTLENSKLGCGPTNKKKWKSGGAYDNGEYGPYLYHFYTAHEFSDTNVKTEQVSPVNDISGSSTYTHGFDWSLNAALTFAKDPSLGLGGGVSFSKSWSYNIPDLEMTFSMNGNSPKWDYKAGTRPTSHWGTPVTHTEAKPILRTDCTVSHSWIWKVPNANGTYRLITDMEVNLEFLTYTTGFFKTNPIYETGLTGYGTWFQLAPPPRHIQEWIMSYTPYSNDVQTTLERQFPKYWLLAFELPVVREDDRTMINSRINTIQDLLNKNRKVLHDKGIDYLNISWKLLDSEDVYHTIEYKY